MTGIKPIRLGPVLIEYHPDLIPAIADLYAGYAETVRGLTPFPPEHWEGIFIRPEVDPRRDVIIATGEGGDPVAFCWLYSKAAPSHVYLRGPYMSPDDPDLTNLLGLLMGESVERAKGIGAGYVEGRSNHAAWDEAYERSGFMRMGAYERWRLFPLKGTVKQYQPPETGVIRGWSGKSDIPPVMELFTLSFRDHWDYVPPRREDWIEVVESGRFDPSLAAIGLEGSRPVGYVFGQLMPDYSSLTLNAAYLVSIGVDPGHRGRGWGSALMSRWLVSVYDAGPRAVELDVDEGNEGAKGLYGKFGFKKVRTEGVWRRYS